MRVVSVRGAGEPIIGNMCSGVVRGLSNVTELDYRAEIRPIGLLSYAESVAAAKAALRRVEAAGEPYVIVCFSLGAAASGDFVMIERPTNCKGIVLLADPLRARGQCTNSGVARNNFGLAGERTIAGIPVHSFAIPDDPITACPGDNGLRTISDRVTGRRQPIPAQWWNAGYTIDWALKYLSGGRHVAYGAERMPGDGRTYIQAASDALRGML